MRRVRDILSVLAPWDQMTLSLLRLFLLNTVALAENGVRFQTTSSYGSYCKWRLSFRFCVVDEISVSESHW